MEVATLRIGHRLVRDDRVTTHSALVARAFGCSKIYMSDVDESIIKTVEKVATNWGRSDFLIEICDDWKEIVRMWKKDGAKIIHLTMYGMNVDNMIEAIRSEDKILVVIGAKKVPRELFEIADMNIAIGNQPHSEIAALAVFLDRIFSGNELKKGFGIANYKIIPDLKGKSVEYKSVRNRSNI
jgi:tRNA (cytidine56-2'-O)-methyltransferase